VERLAAVAVKMGVLVAVVLARVKAVGGDKDNHCNSDCGGPGNNQLLGPMKEMMAVAMVMATETAMMM
jgi:hypothetical protein